MRFKTLLFILVLLAFVSAPLVRAQEQGPGLGEQGIKNYLLGPGAMIDIRVFGQPDFNILAEIDSDGNLSSLPFTEKPIPARCRNEKEVAKDIVAVYSKYLKSPQVSVRVTGRNSRSPATVFGAVHAPTQVQMKRRAHLTELIALSGGFTERANGKIQIVHTEPVMCPEPGEVVQQEVDGLGTTFQVITIAALKSGKDEANPLIRPGDIITVLEAEPVYITGSVISPQGLYLRDELTLSSAIAMVGGVRKEAKSNEIRIYRKKEGVEKEEILKVDYDAIKKRKKPDVKLEPFDVIEVPEAGILSSRRFGQTLAQSVLGMFSSSLSSAQSVLQYRIIY